jgi:hypothetical protein
MVNPAITRREAEVLRAVQQHARRRREDPARSRGGAPRLGAVLAAASGSSSLHRLPTGRSAYDELEETGSEQLYGPDGERMIGDLPQWAPNATFTVIPAGPDRWPSAGEAGAPSTATRRPPLDNRGHIRS